MSLPGGGELIIILLVVMMLFGASRLPKLARSMGQAGKEFKEGIREGADKPDGASLEGPCPFCETDIPAAAQFCPGCGRGSNEVIAARTSTVPQTA